MNPRLLPAPVASPDVLVLALVKNPDKPAGHPARETYVFLYDDSLESKAATLQALGRFAAHPELIFDWYDAAKLSQRIRREADK